MHPLLVFPERNAKMRLAMRAASLLAGENDAILRIPQTTKKEADEIRHG